MGKSGNAGKRRGIQPQNQPHKRSDDAHNVQRRQLSHSRLDEVLDLGIVSDFYGKLSIDVHFEAGLITRINQRLDRCDKPATT